MVMTETTFVCDTCGRKKSVAPTDEYGRLTPKTIPDGWANMIAPFGLCCDRCMNAFMNVYDSLRR